MDTAIDRHREIMKNYVDKELVSPMFNCCSAATKKQISIGEYLPQSMNTPIPMIRGGRCTRTAKTLPDDVGP